MDRILKRALDLARGLFCVALGGSALWAAEVDVPAITARVTDQTRTLSPDQKDILEQRLAAFEKSKGSQVAVLLVPTTAPDTIETYSIRVVDAWKLGRKGVDDGVLIIVAKNDRAVRIEVGRGLEGVLPDVICKRIIDENIVPFFKEGDYFRGLSAGTERVMAVVSGEPLPPPSVRERPPNLSGKFFFALIARAIFGQIVGSLLAGAVIGWILFLLSSSWLLALGAGFFAALVLWTFGETSGRGFSGGTGRWRSGGGFGGGGWSGGGGGFGGGGGTFGGGGASGRW